MLWSYCTECIQYIDVPSLINLMEHVWVSFVMVKPVPQAPFIVCEHCNFVEMRTAHFMPIESWVSVGTRWLIRVLEVPGRTEKESEGSVMTVWSRITKMADLPVLPALTSGFWPAFPIVCALMSIQGLCGKLSHPQDWILSQQPRLVWTGHEAAQCALVCVSVPVSEFVCVC